MPEKYTRRKQLNLAKNLNGNKSNLHIFSLLGYVMSKTRLEIKGSRGCRERNANTIQNV